MTPQGVAAGDVWLPDIEPPGDWVARAACRGRDVDSWFPGVGERGVYRAAVAVCESCVVRPACLEYALRWRLNGIWGGLSERDRKRLRGRVSRAPRPAPGHGTSSRYHYGCRCGECREAHRVEAARYREAAKDHQAGHVQVHDWMWIVFLVVFIIVGLRLLGMAL